MVCMSAFFTGAPFNMYANAGRLHSHTRRPTKRRPGARIIRGDGLAALDRWVCGDGDK